MRYTRLIAVLTLTCAMGALAGHAGEREAVAPGVARQPAATTTAPAAPLAPGRTVVPGAVPGQQHAPAVPVAPGMTVVPGAVSGQPLKCSVLTASSGSKWGGHFLYSSINVTNTLGSGLMAGRTIQWIVIGCWGSSCKGEHVLTRKLAPGQSISVANISKQMGTVTCNAKLLP